MINNIQLGDKTTMEQVNGINHEIAQRFSACRHKFGWTQVEVACQTHNVSTGTVSRVETGQVDQVTYGRLIAIAETLDTSPDYLLCRTDEIATYSGGQYLY